GLLDSLLSDDAYYPAEPRTLNEVGVSPVLIESIACKFLLQIGTATGREIARKLCLPFPLLEEILSQLRVRQVVVHTGQGQLNGYACRWSDVGIDRARAAAVACAYVGPIPVPLDVYILSVEAQSIRSEVVRREDLIEAFRGISAEPTMLDIL